MGTALRYCRSHKAVTSSVFTAVAVVGRSHRGHLQFVIRLEGENNLSYKESLSVIVSRTLKIILFLSRN